MKNLLCLICTGLCFLVLAYYCAFWGFEQAIRMSILDKEILYKGKIYKVIESGTYQIQ